MFRAECSLPFSAKIWRSWFEQWKQFRVTHQSPYRLCMLIRTRIIVRDDVWLDIQSKWKVIGLSGFRTRKHARGRVGTLRYWCNQMKQRIAAWSTRLSSSFQLIRASILHICMGEAHLIAECLAHIAQPYWAQGEDSNISHHSHNFYSYLLSLVFLLVRYRAKRHLDHRLHPNVYTALCQPGLPKVDCPFYRTGPLTRDCCIHVVFDAHCCFPALSGTPSFKGGSRVWWLAHCASCRKSRPLSPIPSLLSVAEKHDLN